MAESGRRRSEDRNRNRGSNRGPAPGSPGTNRGGSPRGRGRTPAPAPAPVVRRPGATVGVAPGLGQGTAPVPGYRPTTDPGAAAAAAAAGAAAAAQRRAGQGYLDRAKNLEPQIRALQYALGDQGFKTALDQNLADLLAAHTAGVELLKETQNVKSEAFLGAARDTEKATAGQAGSAFENLVRERQDTMAGLLQQGAGETDALRAMVMAARQFRDNQAEGNRAYFDTMRSVKSGLEEVGADTRTALQNAHLSAEAERDRLWQNYYDRRSDTYTQLGNLFGQQGEYYIAAKENEVGGGDQAGAAKSAEEAYMNAAKESAKSYVQQGVPQWIKDWKGVEAPKARQANTDLAAATQFEGFQQAEGAGLRTW